MPAPSIGRFTLDDTFLETAERKAAPCFRVYRPPATLIVAGAGSRLEREVDLAAAAESHIAVVRRQGGGCAVVLDPGNVIVSVVLPLGVAPGIRTTFEKISLWLIQGLANLGLPGVTIQGVSDLTLGDRKIGGSCLHRGRLVYYSGTLLVEARIDQIERFLPHPPREPEYRKGRRHGDFLLNLGDLDQLRTAWGMEKALGETLDLNDLLIRLE